MGWIKPKKTSHATVPLSVFFPSCFVSCPFSFSIICPFNFLPSAEKDQHSWISIHSWANIHGPAFMDHHSGTNIRGLTFINKHSRTIIHRPTFIVHLFRFSFCCFWFQVCFCLKFVMFRSLSHLQE
jgi:hypothetical protein